MMCVFLCLAAGFWSLVFLVLTVQDYPRKPFFLNWRYPYNLVSNKTKPNSVKVWTTSDSRANSGGLPSPAWWVGMIEEDSRRHMSLYHLLEDGHPTDEVWAVDHRQPIYLPFTRRITSTKSWPPYVKALSLALQLAEGDKIQLKTVFFSLCFLCFFFSSSSLYISVTNSCLLIFWR